MTLEEAYGQHRRIKQGLAQATRDYYTGRRFNSDSARFTAADVLMVMELTVQEEAAVRALCHAVNEQYTGPLAVRVTYEETKARIDALGQKEKEEER
jgi:hypothetical protein